MDYEIAIRRLPEHMREGARKYVEQGIPPGGFLTAVLRNSLYLAFATADETNRARMADYAAFLETLPINCWGSRERVDAWIKQGGLEGLRKQA